jgi:hypothetical protein
LAPPFSRPQLNPHLYYRKWCYVEEIIYIPCDRKHKVRLGEVAAAWVCRQLRLERACPLQAAGHLLSLSLARCIAQPCCMASHTPSTKPSPQPPAYPCRHA